MQDIYYDPSSTGGFGGVSRLAHAAGKTLSQARQWLSGEDAYTLHKPIREKFRRRKVFVVGVDQLWQIDLVDLSSLARYNDGFKFLLTVIDCFSRYAFAVPLKNKASTSVRHAFARTIETRRPVYVQSDKGREFLNAIFLQFLKENGIIHYTSENDDIKCALVERFNRTLKTKMWRYFTYKRTLRYLDVLQDLVDSYNNTKHSTIKMAPSEVDYSNEQQVLEEIYGDTSTRSNAKWKFEIDDKVRISESRMVFKKAYKQRWSMEIFKVTNRLPTDPPTYEIEDYSGEPIKGKFYAEELQKVTKQDDVFIVESVLKTRRYNGKVQYLVRWVGYPPKFDSWVDSLITNE